MPKQLYERKLEYFRLSPSKLEQFIKCPHCLWLDRISGVAYPDGSLFTLNNAVDVLAKKEFDIYRETQAVHPLLEAAGLKLIPFSHPDLEGWRAAGFKGIEYLVPGTKVLLTGAIDDLWVDLETKTLYVVDYKAASVNGEANIYDDYHRQIEIYIYLMRNNAKLRDAGYTVADTAYFVSYNWRKNMPRFDGKLEFHQELIQYQADCSWIEAKVKEVYKCLNGPIPAVNDANCKFCKYTTEVMAVRANHVATTAEAASSSSSAEITASAAARPLKSRARATTVTQPDAAADAIFKAAPTAGGVTPAISSMFAARRAVQSVAPADMVSTASATEVADPAPDELHLGLTESVILHSTGARYEPEAKRSRASSTSSARLVPRYSPSV